VRGGIETFHNRALAHLQQVSRGEWLRVVGGEAVDEREVLIEGAGYLIHATPVGLEWYALLPGEKVIRRAASEGQNYLGFFSSKDDLLAAVSGVVGQEGQTSHELTEKAWDAMHIDDKLGCVHK
jgi:hypothetical protein